MSRTLLSKIKACTLCAGHLPLPPKPILQLDSSAKILIAGQAPGKAAHQYGKPFWDQSGRRLRDWLGVSEQDFYDPKLFAIVPMAFCYPGKGVGGDLPPLVHCQQTWHQQVMQQLSKLELIIVLGKHAMDYHISFPTYAALSDAIKDWQSLLPNKIVLPHPSPRNQHYINQRPWFESKLLPELKKRVGEIINRD